MSLTLWPDNEPDGFNNVWSKTQRDLAPHIAEYEQRNAVSKAEGQRLATVAAASKQYVPAINRAVEDFNRIMWAHKADFLWDRIRADPHRLHPYRTPLVNDYNFGVTNAWLSRDKVNRCQAWVFSTYWHVGQRYSCTCDHYLSVRSDGIWCFYHQDDNYYETEYGFNHDSIFVPSSFTYVEKDTVVSEVANRLAALLYYYDLPLPGS